MPEQDAGTLTTLTVTTEERQVIAHSLSVTMAMQEALGYDPRNLMLLWARVAPGENV